MEVAVVGGGVIGLSVAWRLAQADCRVTVIDKASPHAASLVAAGLLIKAGGRISPPHLALRSASADLFAFFASELEMETGLSCGFNQCGMLTVCYQPKAETALPGLSSCLSGLGIELELLSREQCLEREPELGEDVGGGFFTRDHQVNPARLVAVLRKACIGRGVTILEDEVLEVEPRSVVCLGQGRLEADKVVIASGAWTRRLLALDIYPVKGEVIHYEGGDRSLNHNLNVQKEDLYVANRGDGRLVVGSTEEEVGFETTADSAELLHRKACRLLPFLKDRKVVESRVGFRPKLRDGFPIMGEFQGLVVASAHYRNGVLLAPITADLIGRLILKNEVPSLMEPFLPERLEN